MFTEHIGKYSRLKLERRFLLPSQPDNLGGGWRITDSYLIGTRLRLRRIEGTG